MNRMPKALSTWTVYDHDDIEKLDDNLWTVIGSLPNIPLKRIMTIVRLDDGGLVIHGPIALREEAMAELEAFGKPAFIVVPNRYHRLDSVIYKKRYPEAQILVPSGSRRQIEEVVPVDLTYEEFASGDTVSFTYPDGVGKIEAVMRVRSPRGTTLVFTDVLFNVPHAPGFSGMVLRLVGSSGGPKVTRIGKLFVVKDKAALAASLRELARTENLVRVIPGHGVFITEEPGPTLDRVAAAL